VCKLSDFGTSKEILIGDGEGRSFKGSPYWMAPEVIKSNGHGWFADIWSLGCTVIEMLTGSPPYKDCENEFKAMTSIANATEHPKYPEGISMKLEDFLNKCFAINPNQRYNVY